MEQATLTLNLLRNSRVNPKLSAWAYINGNHDFNKVPLLPPGTQVLIHVKSEQRASWDYHGESGWYIAPALDHYRCLKCYVPKIRKVRISDTVQIIPNTVPIPTTNIDDHTRKTLNDLVHLLHAKTQKNIPINGPSSIQEALIKVAQLLNRDSPPNITSLA